MNSFYIKGCANVGDTAFLADEDARHAARVLRLKTGDTIYVTDEAAGRFQAQMQTVSDRECSVQIISELPSNEAGVRVTLYQGVPKADKLELIVQKLTELGAACIVPVKMERCVVKLDEKDGKKRAERFAKIAREASKQCKRALTPEIEVPMTVKQLQKRMQSHDLLMVPWEDARGYGMKNAFDEYPQAKDIGIIIGPEGGMSAKEIAEMEAFGAKQISLGPRILRAETAAVACAAMAMTLWGDLG